MFVPIYIFISLLVISKRSFSENRFDHFNRYDEVMDYIKALENKYPNMVQIEDIGKSYENRAIPCIKISSNLKEARPIILVDAGIHAREWLAPAVALYIIHSLVENNKNENMISNIEWIIIPVVNPDGYEYTHTNERLWRKNRSKGKICDGVDLNRNFGFHWMEQDSSDNECMEIYAGPKAFSEPETRNLKNLITKYKDRIKAYITVHAYGPVIMYPWSYTGAEKPENAPEHATIVKKMADAIKKIRGTTYKFGPSTEVFSSISGVSDDWAKGVMHIPLIFTIELPAGGKSGFDPPATDILPVVTETFEAFKVLHNHIQSKRAHLTARRRSMKRRFTGSRNVPRTGTC